MTISGFVHRSQRLIVIAAVFKAIAIVSSAVLVILAVGALLSLSFSTVVTLSAVVAICIFGFLSWRARAVRSPMNVALWLEETIPSMHYEIVTSAGREVPLPELERAVRIDGLQPYVTRRIVKVLLRAALLLVSASLIYLFSPATSFGRGRIRTGLAGAFPGAFAPVNKLGSIRIRIAPPAYSGQRPLERVDIASVTTLSGSKITFSGPGSPDGVLVTIDGTAVPTTGDDDEWTAGFAATKPVSIVRITHNAVSRVAVIEAVPDKPPQVVLTSPLRDTTLRTPRYSVVLYAEATDDLRITQGYFEYLIVSGTGEAFSGRTLTSSSFRFDSRTGRMQARLDLAAMSIVAGDLVSVRAIVRDNNTLTGPSIGTSDTRSFRVARADEYDSVSIEAAAPPPVDSSAMSQRMLILMTEALVKKQKTLARTQLVKESDDIGFMEDRIRKRVYDILYQTDSPDGPGETEEAESEIQAINNPDLKQAYDALWDAVRSLRIAEPAVALPPMRIALKALDRARLAKRLYLRGAAPTVVIDIPRVRMTGKEKGAPSIRKPQSAADSTRRMLLAGFESAAQVRKTDPRGAIERFSLLRARALTVLPGFANALLEVIAAMEHKGNVGPALVRARRMLSAPSGVISSGEWGGG